MKTCSRCGAEKPLEDFYRRYGRNKGHHTHCKACHNGMTAEWRRQNPERAREIGRRSWEKKPAEERYAKGRRGQLRARFNLSPDEVEAMVASQGGRCAICQQEARLVVDHDHQTGRVRALLCYGCNTGLGQVERVGLESFADYLRRWNENREPVPE